MPAPLPLCSISPQQRRVCSSAVTPFWAYVSVGGSNSPDVYRLEVFGRISKQARQRTLQTLETAVENAGVLASSTPPPNIHLSLPGFESASMHHPIRRGALTHYVVEGELRMFFALPSRVDHMLRECGRSKKSGN